MSALEAYPELLTTQDIATILRMDMQAVWKIIRENQDVLAPYKIGREYRIEKQRFEHYLSLRQTGNRPTE